MYKNIIMNLKFYTLLVLMIFLGKSATAQSPVKTITDSDLVGGCRFDWVTSTFPGTMILHNCQNFSSCTLA